MKIKTYLVSTVSEAVERIKREMGPQAVILSTRKSSMPSRWWGHSSSRFEVTAAVDIEPRSTVETKQNGFAGQAFKMIHRLADEKIDPLRIELDLLKNSIQDLSTSRFSDAAPVEKKQEIEAVVAPESQPLESKAPESEPIEALPVETDTPLEESGENILTLCRHLLWHRLDASLVEDLSQHLLEIPEGSNLREEAAIELLQDLPVVAPYIPGASPRIVVVVGPTGSGKTTTIAKMASQLMLHEKKTVAFVNLDTFRIGAEEQIKKYAEILQVPYASARNNTEFKEVLTQFKNTDVILVDTTGTSPRDDESIKKIVSTINIDEPLWTALVVPATLHDPELAMILSRFKPTQYSRLVITKLDEVSTFGTLYNASYRSQCPIAALTMGQQVPEDYEAATAERIIDCLLNFSGLVTIPELVEQEQVWAAEAQGGNVQ